MKMVWCPEMASKAYMAAVKVLTDRDLEESDVAELVSAMAGGWKAKLVVQAWALGDRPAVALGLAAAAGQTRGRHVCVVPDEKSAVEYVETIRRMGGAAVAEAAVVAEQEAGDAMEGVEMMVVDLRRWDEARELVRRARAGARGMVVVCKKGGLRSGEAAMMVRGAGKRVVRSTFLPIGKGVEILHVGAGKVARARLPGAYRWVTHVDRETGEEHVFRRSFSTSVEVPTPTESIK